MACDPAERGAVVKIVARSDPPRITDPSTATELLKTFALSNLQVIVTEWSPLTVTP
jgi:hypothetical protein